MVKSFFYINLIIKFVYKLIICFKGKLCIWIIENKNNLYEEEDISYKKGTEFKKIMLHFFE